LRAVSKDLGFFADEVPEVRLRGRRIGSTRIRELLHQGQVNLARRMLGRPYGVEGRVVRGAARGVQLGFPTANIQPHNRVIPRGGVYVTATLITGKWRRSVTNIGTRPTFDDGCETSVETHVMNWSGDLYGDVVRVRFLHRLRDEQKFESVDQLKAQIERDVARGQRYFERNGVRRSLSIV
jgi:riboflavin kinase/FMN adenylyltransferase